MQYQKSKGRGVVTKGGVVPVIPGACIFDLARGNPIAPSAENVLRACEASQPFSEVNLTGAVGPGVGATICKTSSTPCQGAVGMASVEGPHGLRVIAVAVVNAFGSVVGSDGSVLAHGGLLLPDGTLENAGITTQLGRVGNLAIDPHAVPVENTTLVAVFANVDFDRLELIRIARMASAGMARALTPAFAPLDGDVIFAVAAPELSKPELATRFGTAQDSPLIEMVLGQLAADAVAQAIRAPFT